jgi:ribosome-associated protein
VKGIHLARRIARMAWAKKADDVVILDLRGLTDTTDFFVISTGQVGMHVRAITDFVMDEARALGDKAHVSERDSDEWMVVDFVDVIFHCFQPQKRRHYNLERLWCDAPRMELNPETGTAATLKSAREELEERRRTPPLKAKPLKTKEMKLLPVKANPLMVKPARAKPAKAKPATAKPAGKRSVKTAPARTKAPGAKSAKPAGARSSGAKSAKPVKAKPRAKP